MSIQPKDNIGFFKFQDHIIQCKLNGEVRQLYSKHNIGDTNFLSMLCFKLCVMKIFNHNKEIVNFIKNSNYISIGTNITVDCSGNFIIDNIGVDSFKIYTRSDRHHRSNISYFTFKIFKIYDLASNDIIHIDGIKYKLYDNGIMHNIEFENFKFENKDSSNHNLDLNTKFNYVIHRYYGDTTLSIYNFDGEKNYYYFKNNKCSRFSCENINDKIHLRYKNEFFIYNVIICKKKSIILEMKKYKENKKELICFYKMYRNDDKITVYVIDSKEDKMKLIFDDSENKYCKFHDPEYFGSKIIKMHNNHIQTNRTIISIMTQEIKNAKEKLTQWFYRELLTIK